MSCACRLPFASGTAGISSVTILLLCLASATWLPCWARSHQRTWTGWRRLRSGTVSAHATSVRVCRAREPTQGRAPKLDYLLIVNRHNTAIHPMSAASIQTLSARPEVRESYVNIILCLSRWWEFLPLASGAGWQLPVTLSLLDSTREARLCCILLARGHWRVLHHYGKPTSLCPHHWLWLATCSNRYIEKGDENDDPPVRNLYTVSGDEIEVGGGCGASARCLIWLTFNQTSKGDIGVTLSAGTRAWPIKAQALGARHRVGCLFIADDVCTKKDILSLNPWSAVHASQLNRIWWTQS
jgi:hypothetical protein